jgi:hypothetical protein
MHFAEINPSTNEVLRIIVCDSREWCENNLGGKWARTYYSTPGKNYAGQGYIYHSNLENFSSPQPFPSWKLDNALVWQAPIERPTDGKKYIWNEDNQSWDTPKTDVSVTEM